MKGENLKEPALEQSGKFKKSIGYPTALALVVGQTIGTGIFMTPQGMAEISNPFMSILACAITGLGAILLALCFAELGEKIPKAGSAIVYTKMAFGDFAAFLVGWAYWSGCWLANGAIILGGVTYLSYFFPEFIANGWVRFFITTGIVWFYTFLNIKGVKRAVIFNLVITIVKFLPIILFIIFAAMSFQPENLHTVSSPDLRGPHVLPAGIAYMLWCFMGFEGITMNAAEAKNPEIVKRATIIGTIGVVLLYMLLLLLAFGSMPQDEIAQSSSVFSHIIYNATGWYWIGGFLSLGVFVSSAGCIGAWILSSARGLYAMSEERLFPRTFGVLHPEYGTPHKALIVNSILISLVLLVNIFAEGSTLYNILVLLAVTTFLFFYAFGAASQLMLLAKKEQPFTLFNFIKNGLVALLALVYSIYTIYGSGADAALMGFVLMMAAIPVYIYCKFQYNDEQRIRMEAGLKHDHDI